MPGTISEYVEEGKSVQYTALASVIVLTYDYLITFCDEVELVWYSKWNTGKYLFFATRYLGFVDSVVLLIYLFRPGSDEHLCKRFAEAFTYLTIVGVLISETLMISRVCALWGNSRRILLFLVSSGSGGSLAIFLLSVKEEVLVYAPPAPGLPPCIVMHMNTKPYYISFALLMIFECIIMLLTFWKGVVHWNERIHQGTLMVIFYRDGAPYFSLLFALSAANFVVLLRGRFFNLNGNYYGILTGVQRTLHSVVMSRMIMNLRELTRNRPSHEAISSLKYRLPVSTCSSGSEDTRI